MTVNGDSCESSGTLVGGKVRSHVGQTSGLSSAKQWNEGFANCNVREAKKEGGCCQSHHVKEETLRQRKSFMAAKTDPCIVV